MLSQAKELPMLEERSGTDPSLALSKGGMALPTD